MATPSEGVIRRKYRWKTPSTLSTTPNSAVSSSYLKQEYFLYDWWLIQVDSEGHGKQLGVGGFTSRESKGVRCFCSAPIAKRYNAVTLTTADNINILLNGHLNRSRTLESGFSPEVCEHFTIGFPYYWEEYVTVSVDKEQEPQPKSEPEGIPGKETPRKSVASVAEKESSELVKSKSYEPNLNHEKVMAKRRSKSKLEDAEYSGRLTRSRTRRVLLNKQG